MSRARGNALPNALARYLRLWWPFAEPAGAGRNGTDILGTPGVVWEVKTAVEFKRDFKPTMWVEQAKRHAALHPVALLGEDGRDTGRMEWHADIPVVVYFPKGVGAANVGNAMAIVPLHVQMQLLQEAGYT